MSLYFWIFHLVKTANAIWRDFVTDGVPASGKWPPHKPEIREWGTWLEAFVSAGLSSGSSAIYDTRANLEANLVWIANTLAWVVADPIAANNGIYRKIGASGTGSWSRVADLPYSFIRLNDAGAGTANAIIATSSLPLPASPSAALLVMNVFEANTGAVTIAANGASPKPLVTNTGNALSSGYLQAGMFVAFLDDGTSFRLLTDVASAAIQAAAEAAAADAIAAAAGVNLPLAVADTMLVQRTAASGYDPLTAPAVRRFLGHGKTISYFDFVPRPLRDGIADGTDTVTDQAPYWQAFRDALQAEATAGRFPHGLIPKCVIRTSVSPNFAIPFLKLDTEGCPRIICTTANPGFRIDGTGLGPGGWGLFGLKIGSLMAGTATGAKGIEIRYCHQTTFEPLYCLGATTYGIYISFCVSSVFNKPAVSTSYLGGAPFLATPQTGVILTAEAGDTQGTACGWCTVIGPIGEYVAYGLWLDKAQGTILIGGTAESCSQIGLVMTTAANYTTIIGTDFEANVGYDVYCSAVHCAFFNIKSQDYFIFRDTAGSNVVIGGQFNKIECSASTKHNTFRDLLFAGQASGFINDFGDRNRFINCWNHQTEKVHSEWKTISGLGVSSTGGTAPTATAVGRFFVDGQTVHFTVEVTVTTGSGSGALTVALPYAAKTGRAFCFSGIEIGHDGDGVTGYLPSGSATMQVRHATGAYPGDINGNVIVISGTYEIA